MEITQDMVGFSLKLVEFGPDGSPWGCGTIGADLVHVDTGYSDKDIIVGTKGDLYAKLQSDLAAEREKTGKAQAYADELNRKIGELEAELEQAKEAIQKHLEKCKNIEPKLWVFFGFGELQKALKGGEEGSNG